MTNQHNNIEPPETMTLDVNAQSYSQGYNDAYESCDPKVPLYLGHPAYYWGNLAANWLPLLLLCVALLYFIRRLQKKQIAKYDAVNATVLERQAKALESMEKTNQLLKEISQKLDKLDKK